MTTTTYSYQRRIGYHNIQVGQLISISGIGMGKVINWMSKGVARRILVVELCDAGQPAGATIHYEVTEDTDIEILVPVS